MRLRSELDAELFRVNFRLPHYIASHGKETMNDDLGTT
jgi:hypothetical protein